MPGCISGFYGFQRHGKTAMAYLIAEGLRRQHGIPVYSNMSVQGWNQIDSLQQIPLDYEPKTLLLDEVYYFMDSRSWKDNKESTIFFNTIGKQNINLMITAIRIDTVEKRLRDQHNYIIFARSDSENFYYRFYDVIRNRYFDITIKKTDKFFSNLKYNTNQIPDFVDCDFSFLKANNKKSIRF